MHRDDRAAASEHPKPGALPERARHREPVSAIPQPEACQDVRRRAAVRPGVQSAVCQAWRPVPALRTERVLPSERAWRQEQRRPDVPQAQLVKAQPESAAVLPKASDAPVLRRAALLRPAEAAVRDALQAELPREAAAVCAVARPEAVLAPDAGALQPEAATAAWERRAAAEEALPDGPQAAGAAVQPDAAERQPAAVLRADAEVQPRAAVRQDVRAQPAELRLAAVALPDVRQAAGPSLEAASICRLRTVVSALARPRAAARFAHAMRSLRIASR